MRGLWGLLEGRGGWVLVLERSKMLMKQVITMWSVRWGQIFGNRI